MIENKHNFDTLKLKKECDDLKICLEESLKLQSHYAELLNMFDGGERKTFNKETWIERLKELDII
jgi:hypothetical protein